jgi:Tfp pilus assembly protein PilF
LSNQAIEALEKQSAAQAKTATKSAPRSIEQSRDLYNKGLVMYSQGDIKGAAGVWEEAVRVDSDNALARNAYNRARIEMNEKP